MIAITDTGDEIESVTRDSSRSCYRQDCYASQEPAIRLFQRSSSTLTFFPTSNKSPKNKSPPIVSPIHTRTRDGNRFCFGRSSRESRDKTRNIVHEFLCLLLPLDYFVQSRVLASEGGNFQFLTKRNEEIFHQIRIVREPSCPKKWNF